MRWKTQEPFYLHVDKKRTSQNTIFPHHWLSFRSFTTSHDQEGKVDDLTTSPKLQECKHWFLRVSIAPKHYKTAVTFRTTIKSMAVNFEEMNITQRPGLARYEEFSTQVGSGDLECYPKDKAEPVLMVAFADEAELKRFCSDNEFSDRVYTVSYRYPRKSYDEIRRLIEENIYSVDNLAVRSTARRSLIEFEHPDPSSSSSFLPEDGKQARLFTELFKFNEQALQSIASEEQVKGKAGV